MLQSLLLGVGIGAVYDMLRALRLHFRCGWAGVALLDTLFWASVLAALFEFGLIAAAGQPRGFVLLTAAGGVGLYLAALSETMLEVLMRLLQMLAKLRRAVYGLRVHCQTVVKQRCSSVKIRFLTKKFKKDSFLFRRKGIK
nr:MULTISPECIES: spore cortex biosynthesis protein YabQ [unclassified Butyricicoccus]